MTKAPDLHWRIEGLFVAYYPNTEDGIAVWREMIEQSPDARFLAIHRKQINAQLKAAGYSVRKSPPVRMTRGEGDRTAAIAKKYYKPIFL